MEKLEKLIEGLRTKNIDAHSVYSDIKKEKDGQWWEDNHTPDMEKIKTQIETLKGIYSDSFKLLKAFTDEE